ncbi:universal stress protein [Aridibaculum aurantiacum]|uniref:universal stress protein n=1 Tax=Aridibaculum aurantiacum TaxID=2810307 RepID=UPI001A9775A2|nr:universal stress protein [Aridibaculum aurantiacum]
MKNILVPTDFSDVAKNAAQYAVQLAKQVGAQKIILYNAYQAPVITEPTMPVVQLIDMDTLKNITDDGLANFKEWMHTITPGEIELETLSEFAVLSNNIEEVCERTKADLVVMGITGGSKLEEVLIGSTAISVVNHSKVPVVVIPPNATYSKINKVALACDFKKIEETTPVAAINAIMKDTGASLLVLHVENNNKHFDDKAEVESLKLQSLLHEFDPQFHFIEHEDFVEGINEFVDTHKIDLLITIPKKHGLFEGLFRRSHTKQLAFHSHVPLMCIHE